MRVGLLWHIDSKLSGQLHAGALTFGMGSHTSIWGGRFLTRMAGASLPLQSLVARSMGKFENISDHKSRILHDRRIPHIYRSLHVSASVLSQLQVARPLPGSRDNVYRHHSPRHVPVPTRPQRNRRDQDEIWPEQLFPSVSSDLELSEEQNSVLEQVLEGKSVFFTGSAGTGKSVLLRAIINRLGGPSDTVAVTASTGIAAVNIGGQTVHSFAGAGLGHAPINLMVGRIRRQWSSYRRWNKVKVLIIDEISMVDATWFDCLEEIARRVRGNKEPFGGIQLVVCGDFFQLPPVPDREITDAPASFVFDAWTWDRCIETRVALTQVFRQKDPKLVSMLNDARIGVVSEESATLLRSLARPVHYEDGIGPTEIYPLRSQADLANKRQLDDLPGDAFRYEATDHLGKDQDGIRVLPERATKLFGQMVVPRSLQLKIGAQVMCLRNVRRMGIVNGSTGRVVDFMRPKEFRREIKIHPQWVIVSSLEPRQTKTTPPEQPSVQRPILHRNWKSKKESEWYEGIEWPVVQFPDGMCAMMGPVSFTMENRENKVEVERLQVPLILAWALTVHKSQGQTLDRVKIDLERTFERGQAYVALSRCTSLEGLEVYNFSKYSVVAHPRVQQWSRQLTTLNSYLNRPAPQNNNRSRSQSKTR